jgi:chromosome segregation ATPase
MSDPRSNTALTTPDVERFVDGGRPPSLIEASLSSARSISDTMTRVIQPQINTHTAAIAAAQGQLTTYGEAIASAKTELGTHTAEITAAQGQITAHGEAIASAKTELDAHGAAIASANKQITAHGEAIASAKTELDAQSETLTGIQTHVTRLGETITRHDQAITFALLGEEGHIGRLDGVVIELARRVAWLEEHCKPSEPPQDRAMPDEAREMREAHEVLRERVTAMEGAIRELVEHGPQHGGSRPPRRT